MTTQYGYLLNECIGKIFSQIHQEFEKNGVSLPNMLMRKNMTEYWWRPLKDYDIYKKDEINEKSIIIDGTEKYELKHETWSKTTYSSHNTYKYTIGYILKSMECYIREYLGYRRLKLPNKAEILKDIDEYYCSKNKRELIKKIHKIDLEVIIKEETIKFLQNNKIPKFGLRKKKEDENEFEQEEKIEVVFNEEQFAKIREKSEEIQKALIIEDMQEKINNQQTEKESTSSNTEKELNLPTSTETMINQNNEIEKKQIDKSIIYNKKEVAKSPNMITDMKSELIQNNEDVQKINQDNEITETLEENVFKKFTYNLNSNEKKIIEILLEKQDVENRIMQIAQSENKMLEIIISDINDKALETIGDTVIESDMSSIYEDYEEDIKQVL